MLQDDREVSIVLCTFNRPDMLREALDSLVAQETDDKFDFEIVIVCGGDLEPTLQVIEEVAKTTSVEIRPVEEKRKGGVIARNRAINEARGQWLAHFDDDQIADPAWLKQLLFTAWEKNAHVTGGAMRLKLPDGCDREFSWLCKRLLGGCVGWKEVRPYTLKEGPGTGTLLVHRSVFDEVGLFDESFTLRGYDTDMHRRIYEAGYEEWYTPHSIAYHVTPPERLTDEYFHELCLHNGWQFARRDLLGRGRLQAVMLMILRIGHSACLHVPRWIAAIITRHRDRLLNARCKLWRTEGYARSVAYQIAPWPFSQKKFLAKYRFVYDKAVAASSAVLTSNKSGAGT